MCLLSSVFSLLVLWLNEALWFVNLVLKVFSVNPMYVLSGLLYTCVQGLNKLLKFVWSKFQLVIVLSLFLIFGKSQP